MGDGQQRENLIHETWCGAISARVMAGLAAADQPHIRDGVVRARHGRVMTKAVRAPVRLATPWMRVVSRASGGASPAGWW